MDDDDFLAAIEADNAGTPAPEEPKAEQPEEPKAPETQQPAAEELVLTEADKAPESPHPEPQKAEPGYVPLAALLDARDKAKAAEAELQRLKAMQQQQPQQVEVPDRYEDPEGYEAFQQAQIGQAIYQQNLRWSEAVASMKHGEETVAAAKEWGFQRCETDPYFNAKVASSPDPIGLVVAEFQREKIASEVTPDDFAQFQAWKQAQQQLQQQQGGQPPPVPPNQTSAKIPPRSLASAPSAGNILTEPVQSDEEVFNEVIPKR